MNLEQATSAAAAIVVQAGLKIFGAIALWLAGRWLIRLALDVLTRALSRQALDQTLARYVEASLSVLLNIALVVSILGFFGVETTTFAALMAAGGVAIGLAWGGLLANFAAGAFLMVLRPFKVGDAVTAAGVTGTVDAIGLFGTTINTADNVMTIVGNNRILSDTIQNYSVNPYRRVDLTVTIDNSVSHQRAIALLQQGLAAVPHVLRDPAPEVDVLQFSPAGPVLCVRPCCAGAHYGQVFFDTNRMIRETFDAAGFPAPVPRIVVQGHPDGAAGGLSALA
jgi:small conductance mechanosensitive channel